MDKAQGKFSNDKHASCSGLPALFGESSYETRNEYMQSRLDARAGKNIRSEKGVAAEMGDRLEMPILQLAVDKLGLKNFQHDIPYAVSHEEYPLEGSIDGIAYAKNIVIKPDNDIIYTEDDEEVLLDGKGILEAKATALMPEVDSKPPLHRGVLQVKALMAITGYSWAAISTLHRTTMPKICVYRRDFAFEKQLKEVILDFERRLKEKDYYPPVTLKDTQIIYSKPNKESLLDLDTEEVTSLCDQITSCEDQIKNLNEIITKGKIRLQELMGNSTKATSSKYNLDWGTITYKDQPEKIIPAKEGYTIRKKTVTIRKIKDE